ncbi:MAG: extracellular solute-binding protein [Phascolarctobacterium sp.]|nr:extracellular solute-binding protein [Phascolarctobacterium sp.]
MRKLFFAIIMALLCAMLIIAGCGKEDKKESKQLYLCSSMNKAFTELIASNYNKKTGVKVVVSYLPAGTQQHRFDYLRQKKIDIWLGGTSEEYFLADEQRILEPYLAKESHKVPVELRNRTGEWTSLYLSYIGLLSNKNNLHAYGLYAPESWDELLAPQLKDEIAMAYFSQGGASFGMLTSIWQLRGREAALQYAAKLNAQNPTYTAGFGEAVDKVYIGKKTVAVVPLDYALIMENRHSHLFATVPKDANRNILTGAAIIKGAPHEELAKHFLDYLMSDEGVALLTNNGYHYMWHVKNYPNNVGRKELLGNLQVPVDDLGWTSTYKSEIIKKWLNAQ